MACPPDWPGYQASRIALAFCCGPVHGERAAVEQDHDHRLAGFGDGLEQLLLDVGQDDIGAVAAGEAFGVTRISSPSRRGVRPTNATTTSAFFAVATAWSCRSSWRGLHSKAMPRR